MLLECHQGLKDYLIIFDYHDDVVVFDSATDAKNAEFYQVKTTSKQHWNFSDVIRKKKNSNSIIGKIYNNKFNCGVKSVNLVSNSQFNFTLQDGVNGKSKDCLCATELTEGLKKKFRECLKTEHKVEDIPFEDIFFFKVSDIGTKNHSDEVLAKLTRFLEERFPDIKSKPVPFYQALFGEVSRKTNYGKTVSEYCGSLKRKSMSKQDFDKQLNNIAIKRNFTELWTSIEPVLISEGFNPLQTRNLRDKWDSLELHLMDSTNSILQKVFQHAKSEIMRLRNQNSDVTNLTQVLKKSTESIVTTFHQLPQVYDSEYLNCITLAAFYE